MRVLHLIHAFNRGGLERWLLSMLREIPRDVCAMDVLCKGGDTGPWAGEAVDLGARIFHYPLRPSHRRFVSGFGKVLREGGYQIIHNHLDVYSGVPVLLAKRHEVPVICTFHNTDFSKAHPWWLRLPVFEHIRRFYGYFSMGYSIRHADLVTAVSQGVLESVVSGRKVLGFRPKVLYLGVDIPPLATDEEKMEFRRSLGFDPDTPLILHVGRFMELKNHRGLISMFEKVLAENPRARLLLVGEGILRPAIEQLARDRGLEPSVRFLGFRDDVQALMSRCDVFLLPSLFEGLPIVALEANACGLPVVGSDVPGLVEAREHGAACILHPVDDVESMAKSVLNLITDPRRARALGMKGRDQVRAFFSVTLAAQRLLSLYSQFLSRTGQADTDHTKPKQAYLRWHTEGMGTVRDNTH
jgi:glycosyltransferase EpsF